MVGNDLSRWRHDDIRQEENCLKYYMHGDLMMWTYVQYDWLIGEHVGYSTCHEAELYWLSIGGTRWERTFKFYWL